MVLFILALTVGTVLVVLFRSGKFDSLGQGILEIGRPEGEEEGSKSYEELERLWEKKKAFQKKIKQYRKESWAVPIAWLVMAFLAPAIVWRGAYFSYVSKRIPGIIALVLLAVGVFPWLAKHNVDWADRGDRKFTVWAARGLFAAIVVTTMLPFGSQVNAKFLDLVNRLKIGLFSSNLGEVELALLVGAGLILFIVVVLAIIVVIGRSRDGGILLGLFKYTVILVVALGLGLVGWNYLDEMGTSQTLSGYEQAIKRREDKLDQLYGLKNGEKIPQSYKSFNFRIKDKVAPILPSHDGIAPFAEDRYIDPGSRIKLKGRVKDWKSKCGYKSVLKLGMYSQSGTSQGPKYIIFANDQGEFTANIDLVYGSQLALQAGCPTSTDWIPLQYDIFQFKVL